MACWRCNIKLYVAKRLLLHGGVHGIKLKSGLRPQTPHARNRNWKAKLQELPNLLGCSLSIG